MLDWALRKISGNEPLTIDQVERLMIDVFMTDMSGKYPVVAEGLGVPAVLFRNTDAVMTYDFALGAGLWALKVDHRKGPDGGLYVVLLDGEQVGIIDGHHTTEQMAEGGCVFRVGATGKKRLQVKMATHPYGGEVGMVAKLDLKRID